uniref:Uncharacterized protein n=1 Tax=Cannabis sativa TaxID=3483 RepID=A0A803PVB7_CANSA
MSLLLKAAYDVLYQLRALAWPNGNARPCMLSDPSRGRKGARGLGSWVSRGREFSDGNSLWIVDGGGDSSASS